MNRHFNALAFALTLVSITINSYCGIPELNWTKRSDWLDVKKDITPAAVGDGKTDDSAAIQAALDKSKLVYLPPGTYLITNSLIIAGKVRHLGRMIIGHGNSTVLIWGGAEGGNMIIDSGNARSTYMGFVLDGNNKAANGLAHTNAPGGFETQIIHKYIHFKNLTDCGLYRKGAPATAEVIIENCVFENCGRGIGRLWFNDYDYTIDGCEFIDCGIGIDCFHGNFYVRNSRFERSKIADIIATPEHSSSIRRCISIGSKQFVIFDSPISPLTIENCTIIDWKDEKGAIVLKAMDKHPGINAAPFTMFDCYFKNSSGSGTIINVLEPGQQIFLSQNKIDGDYKMVSGEKADVWNVPEGKIKPVYLPSGTKFLKDKVETPNKIFDVVKDFGAKADGKTDDSDAIQKAIDAAAKEGNGAIAYLPMGTYAVAKIIVVTGKDYVFGGVRFLTKLFRLKGTGANSEPILEIKDPENITIEGMDIVRQNVPNSTENSIEILHTTSGNRPTKAIYNNIAVVGRGPKNDMPKGMVFKNLGQKDEVLIKVFEGHISVVDSADAKMLFNDSYYGSFLIEGKSKKRNGIIGVLTRLGAVVPYALYVKDNHSFIASDFYVEQVDNGYFFAGDERLPHGRITIQGPKLQPFESETAITVNIENYGGEIYIGGTQFYCTPKVMKFIHKGKNTLDFVIWASVFYMPEFNFSSTANIEPGIIGCNRVSSEIKSLEFKNIGDTTKLLKNISKALDDLRLLGRLDLEMNYNIKIH